MTCKVGDVLDKHRQSETTIDSDPIEFLRENWEVAGQPGAEHYAAAASIFRTYQLVSSAFDRALKPSRLNRTTYHLMATLFVSENMTRPLGQLGKTLMVHPTTVTLVIDQLEKRKLVRRAPHPTDRRTTLATLTPAGEKLVTTASVALAEVNFGLPDTSEGIARRLTTTLRRVRASLGDIE